MRSITIPVADRMECICALDTTFKLGKSLNADIVGYHVQPGKDTPIDIHSGELWAGAALVSPVWTIDNDEEIKKSAANAKALFERMAKKHAYPISTRHGSPEKPCAIFKTREGDPGALFASVGPLHDLIVVSRPPKKGGQKAYSIMVSALLDASTPVLLLPQEKVNLSTNNIAIAWNGGRAEALLVHETLPLLKTAKKVTLLTVGKQSGKGPTGEEMCSYLSAHGIKARAQVAKGKNAGKALEQAADDQKADLLLCGAYTRGRIREMIIGGVTEYLINKSERPIVMLHV